MFRSHKGQTILEYMLIATIIMAGIVIGGPFLARSISGHFRLLEDSVIDSVDEDIRQAPPPPMDPALCRCDPWRESACGDVLSAPGNSNNCQPYERSYVRICTPSGCDDVTQCLPEPGCCQDPVIYQCGDFLQDNCGPYPRNPLPASFPAGYLGTCAIPKPSDPTDTESRNCPIGERVYSIICGVDDPANPSGMKTFFACKDVRLDPLVSGKWVPCGPMCWDAYDGNGEPFVDISADPPVSAEPCDQSRGGDELSSSLLPREIADRIGPPGDSPQRRVTQWFSQAGEDIKMYKAYKVLNTYFDPRFGTEPDCPPGAPPGTDCRRCDTERECEFKCPPGFSPVTATMEGVGAIANGTCSRSKCISKDSLILTDVPYTNLDYDTRNYFPAKYIGRRGCSIGYEGCRNRRDCANIGPIPYQGARQGTVSVPAENGAVYFANLANWDCNAWTTCWTATGMLALNPKFFPPSAGTPPPWNSYRVELRYNSTLMGRNEEDYFCDDDRNKHAARRVSVTHLCTDCPGHEDARIIGWKTTAPGTKVYIVQVLEAANGTHSVIFDIKDGNRVLLSFQGQFDHFMEVIFVSCPEDTDPEL